MKNGSKTSYSMHVALGTLSFTLCFAAWGLISAFAPQFRKIFELTPTQSAALVAAPVLLGSPARIPAGMLTDRPGGRLVISALMATCAVPAVLVPMGGNFQPIIGRGFFRGLVGPTFARGL